MPPKKKSSNNKSKIEVVLLFTLLEGTKKYAEFEEQLDPDEVKHVENEIRKVLKKINKDYTLNFINQQEPGLEVFVNIPKKGWSKKKLDDLGKKIEDKIPFIEIGEHGDRGFAMEYYIEEVVEKTKDKRILLSQKDKDEIEDKLTSILFKGTRVIGSGWANNVIMIEYKVEEKEKKTSRQKVSPVKSTPQKKPRGRPRKN